MIFYCPACWHQVATTVIVCPRCGTDLPRYSDEVTFQEKLMRGVFHPDAVSARRAIWILGELRCEAAVPVFDQLVERGPDVYLLLAIVDSLQKIGSEPARELLNLLSAHPSGIVARQAGDALIRNG